MHLTLKYYGQLRHLADRDEEVLEADAGILPADAVRDVSAQYGPDFAAIVFDSEGALRSSVMVLLNEAPIDKLEPPVLQDGDTLTLLPAISGG